MEKVNYNGSFLFLYKKKPRVQYLYGCLSILALPIKFNGISLLAEAIDKF